MKFLFHLDSFGEYISGGESSDSKRIKRKVKCNN